MSNTQQKYVSSRKKEFIDFNKLSAKELSQLVRKWYSAAASFETRLENTMRFDKTITQNEINVLWNRANQLWKRVTILERWMLSNKKK